MNLREAAQQALEAMTGAVDELPHAGYLNDAITALRAALAEHDPAVQRDLAFQNMARIIRELKEEQQGGQHGS
jgi:hypothetical protein